MIQIDDSGSGSLIGGTCIGVYNTLSKEYYYDIIPLELYNEENFNKKVYLDYAISIVKKALDKFNIVDTSTPIEVCRGYMFDRLRKWLDKNNYNWRNTEITGTLQELVENSFNQYAVSLGFPLQYIQYTKYPFHFHKILRWVYADFAKRSLLCKTGWKSWRKYGSLRVEISYDFIENKNTYHCLKCGRIINPNKRAKVLKYTSNAPNTIYLHIKCSNNTTQKFSQ